MSRVAMSGVLLLGVLSAIFGSLFFGPSENTGRTLSAGLASGTPENECRFGAAGPDSSIVVLPSDPGADVNPAAQFVLVPAISTTPVPGSQLTLSIVTFPPGSHDDLHNHVGGARIIYVQSGAIEYMTGEDELDQAAWHHRPGEVDEGEEVLDNIWVSVEAGEWLTENQYTCHALRNVGDSDAIIVFAQYVILRPDAVPTCFGGCRTRGP
jgi:hypothetical protein